MLRVAMISMWHSNCVFSALRLGQVGALAANKRLFLGRQKTNELIVNRISK